MGTDRPVRNVAVSGQPEPYSVPLPAYRNAAVIVGRVADGLIRHGLVADPTRAAGYLLSQGVDETEVAWLVGALRGVQLAARWWRDEGQLLDHALADVVVVGSADVTESSANVTGEDSGGRAVASSPPMDELITTTEAADVLGVERATVAKHARAGRWGATKRGGAWMFERSKILAERDRRAAS